MCKGKYGRSGSVRYLVLIFPLFLGFLGCNGGPIGERGRVEELTGNDFYRTAEMMRPRYEHVAVTLEDGTVLVIGGSDERLFTSIDVCEIFDQKLIVDPEPPSKSGGWIDTDFEGDELILPGGGRIYHTVAITGEGNVMVFGGAQDGIMGDVLAHPVLFDRSTRKFDEASAVMLEPRFLHTTVALNEGEILQFGGQIHIDVTIVDPNYPPNDPRFIQDINAFPSTRTIEVFDSSIPSDDGLGDFAFVHDDNGVQALLSGNQGRAAHATVRIAGVDGGVGNAGDMFIQVGGIMTLSPVFAPRTKLRRTSQGAATLLNTLDIYDGFTKTAFLAPGVSLDQPRAHGIMADTVGWLHDQTFDGIRGLSNVFLIAGGSTDTLPTMGRWECEGFAAVFTGFGPGNGISLTRTEPGDGDQIDNVIRDVLGDLPNEGLIALVYDVTLPGYADFEQNPLLDYANVQAGIEPDIQAWLGGVENFLASRMGKYFSMEAYFNRQLEVPLWPINRIHTQFVRLVRQSFTPAGLQTVPTLFCGAGGLMYVSLGAQIQLYDEVPVSAAEFFDPYYNLVNGFFVTPHEPYDLDTVRTYWSVKLGIPLPQPGAIDNLHPNPTGSEGAWLITDGFVPGNAFEGYEWIPPYTTNPDDYRIRFMEKGRAWHTANIIPGADGRLGTLDDRVLFAGGGDDVLTWGGQPVTPSAIVYVPPAPR